jgi:ATP-dependent helicase/nuclease subunit A
MTSAANEVDVTFDDAPARERIRTDLASNMLVEAGAGSGKTTSLVGRMHALIVSGEPVEEIAAVTFTRKAAHELRERFQIKLEEELRKAELSSEAWQRCDRALRNIDRAFLGTIHSFCARMLREHPLDVPLDPSFAEVSEEDWKDLVAAFWNRWLDRCKRTGDAALDRLAAMGINPRSLFDGFGAFMTYQDVDFPLADTVAPDVVACRKKLNALLVRALSIMPREEPSAGWDPLMKLIRRLQYHQRGGEWNDTPEFCDVLGSIAASHCKVTQNRWAGVEKQVIKDLCAEFVALFEGDITDVLRVWREHRYPEVLRFLGRAAQEFERERHETGRLGFEDLLMLSAKLLRDNDRVRDALGGRYRRLLVDEFQDTDPIQAEVCFLLASDSRQGKDWRTVVPRPGAIFLVGDPKQSIYRFRRADIQVYEFARRRMQDFGAVLALTSNFRSATPIGDFVNGYFSTVFPSDGTSVQAPFTPMRTARTAVKAAGVYRYTVNPEAKNKSATVSADAAQIASWIASRIESGERTPGDFLILTRERAPLGSYARCLAERNVPVSTTGACLPQEVELKELLVVLRAIADPDNQILVVAALEGLFFGCNLANLYDAYTAGCDFSISHSATSVEVTVSTALRQLNEWWMESQRSPADVVVDRILDDSGLLPFAASQVLGDSRAGALLRLVETLRTASMNGASGIVDAVERIELMLDKEADDAPLRPGRVDAVRIMNLHKAKGLEASVVILAAPVIGTDHPPKIHIVRSAEGVATGGIIISSDKQVIAQPPGWDAMSGAESEFEDAEAQRLLYVAATRAGDELLIATTPQPEKSIWASLVAAIDTNAGELNMVTTPAPGRRRSERTSQMMNEAVESARTGVTIASSASTTRRTVTDSLKDQRETARAYDLPLTANRGAAWGRAVHRCIEAAGRGRTGSPLTSFIAAVAVDEGLAAADAVELEVLVQEVRESDLWAELGAGTELSFELPVMRLDTTGATSTLIEGVLDAAALTNDGWIISDWKTDTAGDVAWTNRLAKYEQQVDQYAKILSALTGHSARGTVRRVRVIE